ncbi:MAG TPA: pyridoxal 5'-phosphate synthase glutaminase subunit PdxT [Candidatus Paceibacterota bacterium]|uniref:glutaminase n=1 Tax=Candidatus Ryanbacteria bacterium RIFCSPHIGHO2_01_FULL_45_22 TaxID=1802114 RepID=A0A1G2FX07_9BACT|nr:MAG: hypothetical protein A2719_01975 [Candidatus Ryanbacteria bacterium RIFCSPHIGHO2_01_FULL_45_22]
MARTLKIGVLSFHGDVEEHVVAINKAAQNLRIEIEVVLVRTKDTLHSLDALIIPGGESTTLQKLCEREGMFAGIKNINKIFGTCAGAILLAKTVRNKEKDQRTLELMDIEVDRNAYGKQAESFEEAIDTTLGKMKAIFIRAPKITATRNGVSVLAKNGNSVFACEQKNGDKYYLATCFHPELTTTLFHEYFLKQI